MASSDPLQDLTPQDFLPISVLGHGDIGTVFLVQLCKDNKSYAMKVMQKEVLRRKGEKRAATEKQVLSMLSHPFLPTLHAHFDSEKHVFFIMDFCSGGDLNVLRQKQPLKRFSESITRFYAAEVVVALEYLHQQGIIYRDLKPENILIQSNGHIMLTDFDLSSVPLEKKPRDVPRECKKRHKRTLGVLLSCFNPNFDVAANANDACGPEHTEDSASSQPSAKVRRFHFPFYTWPKKRSTTKHAQRQSVCRSHSFVGTEEYVAPEVLWGKGHGFPVDWWTLGIFLYEMVYGKTPFKGPNRKETFYNILCREPEFTSQSSRLNDLIKKLLAKDPESRLGSLHGAAEIKRHAYFRGTAWKHLNEVARPPYVPPPVSHIPIPIVKRKRHGEHHRTDNTRPSENADLCQGNGTTLNEERQNNGTALNEERQDNGTALKEECHINDTTWNEECHINGTTLKEEGHETIECDEKENLQNATNSLTYKSKLVETVLSPKPLGEGNHVDMKGRAGNGTDPPMKRFGKPMQVFS